MGFQISQREKFQAIDLLDRITDRLINEGNELRDGDESRNEAIETTTGLFAKIESLRTNLEIETPIDLATLASLLGNYDPRHHGTAAEYFARYFSNFNIENDEFLYAAGYALIYNDQLLREEQGERWGGDYAERDCGCDGESRCSQHDGDPEDFEEGGSLSPAGYR